MRLGLAALLSMVLLSGCFQHVYTVAGTTPEPEPAYDSWHGHILFGLVDVSDPVDLRAACPVGVAKVEDQIGVLNLLVSVVTVFIYTPSTISVYCQVPGPPRPAVVAEPAAPAASDAPDAPDAGTPIREPTAPVLR